MRLFVTFFAPYFNDIAGADYDYVFNDRRIIARMFGNDEPSLCVLPSMTTILMDPYPPSVRYIVYLKL